MSDIRNPCITERPRRSKAMQSLAGHNSKQYDEATERYLSRRELRALFPVSDMTIWRWMHDPDVGFPAPGKLARNGRNFWWLPEILAWEAKRRRGHPNSVTAG